MNKYLSDENKDRIRGSLDNIAELLYKEEVVYEDMFWAHKTIKDLLFVIYMLENEVKIRGKPI